MGSWTGSGAVARAGGFEQGKEKSFCQWGGGDVRKVWIGIGGGVFCSPPPPSATLGGREVQSPARARGATPASNTPASGRLLEEPSNNATAHHKSLAASHLLPPSNRPTPAHWTPAPRSQHQNGRARRSEATRKRSTEGPPNKSERRKKTQTLRHAAPAPSAR